MSTAGTNPELDRDIALARARVVRSPTSVTACYRLSTLLMKAGDRRGFDDAVDSLLEVLQLEPNHPGAHHVLAEALARSGDYKRAWEHLRKAKRLGYQVDPDLERIISEAKKTHG